MVIAILGVHPDTGRLWPFIHEGATLRPATVEEEEELNGAARRAREKRVADVMNADHTIVGIMSKFVQKGGEKVVTKQVFSFDGGADEAPVDPAME